AAPDDADLKVAREELLAVMNDAELKNTPEGKKLAVRAAVELGLTHELTGDKDAAREVYTKAMTDFPEHKATFEAAIERLNALEAAGTSMHIAPGDAERLLFAITILLQDTPKGEETEPGVYYWKAVNLAAGKQFAEAIVQIGKAKTAHIKRAKAMAGRGLNPLSDPLEQIFPRTCNDLAAYWKLRSELYGNKVIAAAIDKNTLPKTLDTLVKAQTDLATEKTKSAKLDKDLTTAKQTITNLTKTLDTTETAKKTAEKALTTAKADLKARDELIAKVVAELKPVTMLPAKYEPAELLAAVKNVVSRATGPDLKNLIPSGMVAIGGGGLSAGQLLELADKLTKAQEALKKVKNDLEAQKLANNKLKSDHAAYLTGVTTAHTASIVQITTANEAALKKLKEDHVAAMKAQAEAAEKEKMLAVADLKNQLATAVTLSQSLDLWLPLLTDLRRVSDADQALVVALKTLGIARPDSEDEAKAHTVAGMALLIKGDLKGARERFQTARRSPAHKAAEGKFWAKVADVGLEAVDDPLALYRLPVEIPPRDLKAAAKSLDEGIKAYKAGRYVDAVKELSDATKYNPDDPVAWYFLGAAYWALDDRKNALKNFAQGGEREKAAQVPGREISAALSPIQGTTRDALDKSRP
ncbi:MAG: tetratricopeptide repeat protein, partial [Planctomycetia bacterium]|nr:tetratricopeptide repeat protein [Planctomycetia bacterium]